MKCSAVARRIEDEVMGKAFRQALASSEILRTIIFPQTLRVLGQQLPKPNYTAYLKQLTNLQNEQKQTKVKGDPNKEKVNIPVQNIVISNNPKEQIVRPKLERNQILRLPIVPNAQ
jgi:hypothetical protein